MFEFLIIWLVVFALVWLIILGSGFLVLTLVPYLIEACGTHPATAIIIIGTFVSLAITTWMYQAGNVQYPSLR